MWEIRDEQTGGPETEPCPVADQFRNLFHTNYSTIFTAAYNRLNDHEGAEDAAAEVFRIAWARSEKRGGVPSLAWLYSTLRHVVGNEYQRRERTRRRHVQIDSEMRVHQQPHDERTSEDQELRALIASLKESDRELIWMAYWEDLTREEMAEILGCSVPAVRTKLVRARKRLKTLIDLRATAQVGKTRRER